MKIPEAATERCTTLMTPSFVERVNEWRRQQVDMPNRSEAIRRLIDAGLEAEKIEK